MCLLKYTDSKQECPIGLSHVRLWSAKLKTGNSDVSWISVGGQLH